MTTRRRFLGSASALLLAGIAAPALAAPLATIKSPMAPPDWALLERQLLHAHTAACEAFYAR